MVWQGVKRGDGGPKGHAARVWAVGKVRWTSLSPIHNDDDDDDDHDHDHDHDDHDHDHDDAEICIRQESDWSAPGKRKDIVGF